MQETLSEKALSLDFCAARNARFITAIERLYEMARREDLKIERLHNPSLPYFTSLSEADQLLALEKIEAMVHCATEITDNNLSLRSSPLFTKSYLKHMGYRVPDELWDKIDELDVIDVYGLDNRMKFACLRFLESLSYSLEELYCRHWMELYRRDRQDVVATLSTTIEEIFLGHHDGIVDMRGVPMHIVVEIDSCQKLQLIDRPKYFSPIFEKGHVVALMCVHRGAVVVKSADH
jgi:hypothetical protein